MSARHVAFAWPTGTEAVRQDYLERAIQRRWPLPDSFGECYPPSYSMPTPLLEALEVVVLELHVSGNGLYTVYGILERASTSRRPMKPGPYAKRSHTRPSDVLLLRDGWTWEMVALVLARSHMVPRLAGAKGFSFFEAPPAPDFLGMWLVAIKQVLSVGLDQLRLDLRAELGLS